MTTIYVQAQTVNNWRDRRTSASRPPHVRIYASEEFFTSNGVLIPAGSPDGGSVYKDIACTQSGTTVTIPAFEIDSTRDASSLTRTSTYSFYFYTTSGAKISLFLSGISVPEELDSLSGCNPSGTCCTLDDLASYNDPSPPLPPDTYPTFAVVRQLIQAALGTAQGPAGLPGELQYNDNGVFGRLKFSSVDGVNLTLGGSLSATGLDSLFYRQRISPDVATYDQLASTFGYGFALGGLAPSSPVTINVPAGKQYSAAFVALTNSGAGKLMGLEVNVNATGAVQDAAEPVRGLFGRATNTLLVGASKTVFSRGGATGLGDAYLACYDGDVTLSPTSNVSSSVFTGTLFSLSGAVDDRASWGVMWAANNERYLLGVGMLGPLKFNAAAYRAWLATGSSAGARGFQQMRNDGTEVWYTDVAGVMTANLGMRMAFGVALSQRNEANSADIEVIKLITGDVIQLGNNAQISTANPYLRLGAQTVMQVVDADGRWRVFNGAGEVFNVSGSTPLTETAGVQVLVTRTGVTALAQMKLGPINSGPSGVGRAVYFDN